MVIGGFATNRPPAKAIAYFEQKKFNISWRWQDSWRSASAWSFVVAKLAQRQMLATMREAIQEALELGLTGRSFRGLLESKLAAGGWLPSEVNKPYRLNLIYRQNIFTSYAVGRYQAQVAAIDRFPYWQYISKNDELVRPSHKALNGQVHKANGPFWRVYYPPNGWNCRCNVRALTRQQVIDRGLVPKSSKELSKLMTPDAGFRYNPATQGFSQLNKMVAEASRRAGIRRAKSKIRKLPLDVRNWIVASWGGWLTAEELTKWVEAKELEEAYKRMLKEEGKK